MRLRMLKKLKEVTVELRRRRHDSVEEQGRYVQALIRGHVQYYGVPLNSRAIGAFRYQVIRLWQKWLSRRSNRAYVDWDRMQRYIARWVPPAVICHLSFGALRRLTCGKSRIWEICTSGSARGVASDRHPYRDIQARECGSFDLSSGTIRECAISFCCCSRSS